MKRGRRYTNGDTINSASLPQINYVNQLVDALRDLNNFLLLRPDACLPLQARTEKLHREAVRSLLLIIVSTQNTSQATAADHPHLLTTMRGLGIIDYAVSSVLHNKREKKESHLVTFRAVPVSIQVAPWASQLPSRLKRLVCDCGSFATVGDWSFGSADVGPVPEGFVPREVVALLHGLPWCRVEAVSGQFPLFRLIPPSTQEAVTSVEMTETRWEVRPSEDMDETTREGLMKEHLERLAPYRGEVRWLSGKMSSVSNFSESQFNAMWVVVSYPGGLPLLPVARDKNAGVSLPPHKRSKAERESATDTWERSGKENTSFPSPLFVLPASFLCQYFHVHAGWQCIARRHREAALDAVQQVREIIEAASLHGSEGTVLMSKVVYDSPHTGTGQLVTLTQASAMQS